MSQTARAVGLILMCGGGAALPAHAQVFEARIGRFYDSPGWTAYRMGFTRPLGGVFAVQAHGDYLQRVGDTGGFAGIGTDLTAFRTGRDGPYLVAGLSGGLGSDSTNNYSKLWGSWSAGAGYDLFPVSFLSVGAEGRWRELSVGRRSGFELAIGLGLHIGRGSQPPDRRPGPVQSPSPALSADLTSSSSLSSPTTR
ncbi:MAG TPA: hypothetical protein VFS51_10350, partial [Gemmatimonadales bacterium]|nr:hypothetical protein [Gemmatimonadales bacterium]